MVGMVPEMFPQTLLFTDLRHIACGDLSWHGPDGGCLPLNDPPEPDVDAVADAGRVPRGIRLQAQPALKTDPVIGGPPMGRIIRDGGVYRAWRLEPAYPPGYDIGCYTAVEPKALAIVGYESADGFHWAEASRSLIPAPGQTGFDGFTFFLDPVADAGERYKAVYMANAPEADRPALWEQYRQVHPRYRHLSLNENYITCMYGAVSADGEHWSAIAEPLMIHKSDTDTTVYWDEWLGRYVMYTRLYIQDRRWVGRAEAEDFRHWGPVQPILWPSLAGPLSDDIYMNARSGYPGVPGTHLMLPMVYHRATQRSEVRMYSSGDGICWSEVPGGPVLEPGAPGTWDAEFVYAGKDLVPFGAGLVGVPYHGTRFPHKYPRWWIVRESMPWWGWAWWQRERLSAVVADGDGEFWTPAMLPAGRRLRVNVRTARAGFVRLGVVGVGARSVDDCTPIVGNQMEMPVDWDGGDDIGAAVGQPVVLHIKMRAAELFAIEWVE